MVDIAKIVDRWTLPSRKPITQAILARAEATEEAQSKAEHHASDAWFDAKHQVVVVVLTDGRVFGARRDLIPALQHATLRQLRDLRATEDGVFIVIEGLDVHLNVDGLVTRLLENSAATVRRLGARLAGSTASAAKAEAAAKNGRLGGRPKKGSKTREIA